MLCSARFLFCHLVRHSKAVIVPVQASGRAVASLAGWWYQEASGGRGSGQFPYCSRSSWLSNIRHARRPKMRAGRGGSQLTLAPSSIENVVYVRCTWLCFGRKNILQDVKTSFLAVSWDDDLDLSWELSRGRRRTKGMRRRRGR
ncbi:unnamed protein product [Ascophyllum nodosum]